MWKKNLLLLLLVVLIAVIPLAVLSNAEFAGADSIAEEAITEISPHYEPWFSSFYEPQSGEIESLLFAVQAVIGSGIVFYIIGFSVGRKKGAENRA